MEYNIDKCEHIDIDDEESIESINCLRYYPGLRLTADRICVKRLDCGLKCRDCKANETNYCISANYWCASLPDTIKGDMIKYFGEDVVTECINEIKNEYGNSIFEDKFKNIDEQVIACYIDDNPIKDIARKFDIKESEVYKIIRRHKAKYYNHRDATILEMFNDGKSLMNIARRYGLSKRAVYRILRLQGVSKQNTVITERNRNMFYQHRSGVSFKDLAEEHGLSEQTVAKIIKSIEAEIKKDNSELQGVID